MDILFGPAGGTFWFTRAITNADPAAREQRSRITRFLISVLLGPLATLLSVVLSPAPRPLSTTP